MAAVGCVRWSPLFDRLSGATSRLVRRYAAKSSGLERYTDLHKVFTRKLKATYQRFSNVPDQSVVCGRDFVYLIDSDGIYRVDRRRRNATPQLVLDLTRLSGGGGENDGKRPGSRWSLHRLRLSPHEKHLAATVTRPHGATLRCVIVGLGGLHWADPQRVLVTLEDVFSFEWATDQVMFYSTLEGVRSGRAFRLDLTPTGSKVTCVHEETQPEVFVEVALTRDRHILTINCSSRTSSEVLVCDVTGTPMSLSVVQSRQENLLYHVEHWRRKLVILASTGPAHQYQVVQAPVCEPSMAAWGPVFSPDPHTVIKDMDVVGDHCVLLTSTASCSPQLILVPLQRPTEASSLQLPSWGCSIETRKSGLDDRRDQLELLVSSPVRPPEPLVLVPERGLLLSAPEGSGPQDAFFTSRLEACSPDGTPVPITLLHSVPVERLSATPLLVHVYGAYGRDLHMGFSAARRLLLELGWTLAYCHVRGGGERGVSWHRRGSAEGKQRTVDDLQACLQHLFSRGVSSPAQSALTACSAGAVPVGALVNRHPHLVKAVTLQAPFLDVLGSMGDPSLPLTLEDREEWGDPLGNAQHREWISSYCPLHNITPQLHPSVLLTAYRGDVRVPLGGVLKYAERLRRANHIHRSNKAPSDGDAAPNVVLDIRPGSDHSGPRDLHLVLEEEALQLAFLYWELGLEPPRPPTRMNRKRNQHSSTAPST